MDGCGVCKHGLRKDFVIPARRAIVPGVGETNPGDLSRGERGLDRARPHGHLCRVVSGLRVSREHVCARRVVHFL